jgi:hypothetical protein
MNIEIHEMVYCKKLKKCVDWRSACNSIQERCVFFGGIDRIGLECNFKEVDRHEKNNERNIERI